MTYAEYVQFIDGRLRAFQAEISALRYQMDEITSGQYKDIPDELTHDERFTLNRSAFAAMNADWDLASARRALQAARDRLTRA